MAKIKSSSKADRNKLTCARYRLELRREKSKARKLMAHIRRCPWDTVARAAFDRLPIIAKAHNGEMPVLTPSPAQARKSTGMTMAYQKHTPPIQKDPAEAGPSLG